MKQEPNQPQNGISKSSSPNTRCSKPVRRRNSLLRIEPLEARRLLASLQVSVFIDQDGSRQFESSQDAPAENRLVFLDLNEDSVRNPGEPVAVTDADGLAQFDSIEPGDYAIGLIANAQTQRVVSSVRVTPSANAISEQPANRILVSQDDQQVWSFDGTGRGTNVNTGQNIELPGHIEAAVVEDESNQVLLVRMYDSEERQIVRFNTETGSIDALPISGLDQDQYPTQLYRAADGFLVEVESTFGRTLVELELESNRSKLGFELANHFDHAAAVRALDLFATATNSPLGSRVFLDDGIQASLGFVDLEGIVSELSFSDDGTLLFAAMANGGVNVIAVSDSELRRTAILADAGRVVSARGRDGRILTGSSGDEGKLIVWDPNTWLPTGTANLPAGAGEIVSLSSDAFGDTAYVGTQLGLYSVDIATVAPTRVSTDSAGQAPTFVGVRVSGENAAPEASDATRELLEDSEDPFDATGTDTVQDADGDQLWFSLATPPSNGQLHVDVDNNWRYQPDANFAGTDTAVLRVHDGQAATDLVLRWDVEAVNDPPVAVHIQLPAIPENPEAGTSIGFISIEDPDQDAEYLVTTSDPRFTIQGGQILFVDGELDFDAEPNVEFEIVATDATNSSYVISSETTLELTNVNEPATGLSTNFEFAPENFAGAEFGLIQVDDPDADSQYEFELSDERFEIVDGVLKLAENVALDFELDDEISLTVTANEVGGEDSISQEVTVNVADGNDQPTGIRISAADVIAGVDGAVVGTVSVEDQDGDAYEISVSDSRFEVADGLLKLRPGQTLQGEFSQLPLTLSARARSGDQLSQSFPINVLPPPPPNQNPADRHDINGDGIVSPLDALFLINEINRGHGGPLPPRNGDSPYGDGESPVFPDVNGDNILSPIDILEIINELNKQDPGLEGEGEYVDSINSNVDQIDFTLEAEREKTAIDAELESLLAEISEYRVRRHS